METETHPFDQLEASERESMLAHIMAAEVSLRLRAIALAYARRMTAYDLQLLRTEMQAMQGRKPTSSAYDQAPDKEALLRFVMFEQNGQRHREVALELLRSLDGGGLRQLRSEMRHRARERQQAGHADNYNPWHRD
jgi:hypothetical protein